MYNTVVQFTNGYNSFHLIFGQGELFIIDTIFRYVPTQANLTLADATRRSEKYRQLSRFRAFDAQVPPKLRYDDQHRNVVCSEGDLGRLWVPVRKQGLSEKRLCQYIGPCRVLRPITPVTYMVEPVDLPSDRRRCPTESAHVSCLKPYITHVIPIRFCFVTP